MCFPTQKHIKTHVYQAYHKNLEEKTEVAIEKGVKDKADQPIMVDANEQMR
jgi:hypothetical protein